MTRYLYLESLPTFLRHVSEGGLSDLLSQRLEELADQTAGEGEKTAWSRSLAALASVLEAPEFASSEIFVELFMPLNGRRCDVLLTGRTGTGPSAVVLELKQWTLVQPSHLPEHVRGGGRDSVHPSFQVRDYLETLRHFHSAFTSAGEPVALHGVAFLHDLPLRAGGMHLREPIFGEVPRDYPLFLQHEHASLGRWLAERLVPGPGKPVAERIRAGHPLPSPKLLDHVVETIKGTKQWTLLDEQKTAYFKIRSAVKVARGVGGQRVIIVRGGPGTGKSVLALQLLADAARDHWAVVHATGSLAFQTVLQATTLEFSDAMVKKIHGVKTKVALPVGHLFTTFADVAKLGVRDPLRLDLTICDEAHRLWQHRRKKYPNGKIEWLSDKPMVREVIAASRVTAFFLDDNQSVRSGEIGNSELIVEHAEAMGIPVERHDLDAQFRCAGSSSYIHWVEHVLAFRQRRDLDWRDHHAYELRIWDDMPSMDEHLRGRIRQGRRCRLVAGYCWRWNKPDGLGKLPLDLKDKRFGAWAGAWIEKTGKDLKPRDHQYFRWATLDEAYEQVGSIYSVQGFEFDDIGLIWGDDLVWRTDRWVAQIDQNKDATFKKELRSSGIDPVEKLLNVYRVLLTRGMRSTHLFILDPETRRHVQACLAAVPVALPLAVGAGPSRTFESGGARERPAAASGALVRPPPFRARLVRPDPENPWATGVPLVDLKVAAGDFGPEQLAERELGSADDWYTWEQAPAFRRGDFLARVEGRSMEPLIPDGSFCLFRAITGAPRSGRTVLVRLAAEGVEEGRYTVKDLILGPEALELRPKNPAYPTLHFAADEVSRIRVIAELVAVAGSSA